MLPSGPCENLHVVDLAKISRKLQNTKRKNLETQIELTDAKKKTQRKKQAKKELEEQLRLKLLDLQIIKICEKMKAITDNIEKFNKEHGRLKGEIRVLEEQLEHLKISGLIRFFFRRCRVNVSREITFSSPSFFQNK